MTGESKVKDCVVEPLREQMVIPILNIPSWPGSGIAAIAVFEDQTVI